MVYVIVIMQDIYQLCMRSISFFNMCFNHIDRVYRVSQYSKNMTMYNMYMYMYKYMYMYMYMYNTSLVDIV